MFSIQIFLNKQENQPFSTYRYYYQKVLFLVYLCHIILTFRYTCCTFKMSSFQLFKIFFFLADVRECEKFIRIRFGVKISDSIRFYKCLIRTPLVHTHARAHAHNTHIRILPYRAFAHRIHRGTKRAIEHLSKVFRIGKRADHSKSTG